MSQNLNLLNRKFDQELVYELLPEWAGLKIDISQLSGGITNKLYRIRSEKGDYTVRIYGDRTDLFIDRDHEAHTIAEMAKIGVSSKLVKYMPERGVTIVEFIDDAIVLTNDHFQDKALHELITAPIRAIHNSGATLQKVFNPLLEVAKMAAILADLNASYPEFDIAGTQNRLAALSKIIDIDEKHYTACHNDLLADNFILIKAEARHKYRSPMYIIDWEYGGMAPKYYDFADMFQEILAPRETEKQLVAAYCQGKDVDQFLYYVDLYKPFPDIYWFLWSLIQRNISKIDFDYYTYGKVKYENAMENMKKLDGMYSVKV